MRHQELSNINILFQLNFKVLHFLMKYIEDTLKSQTMILKCRLYQLIKDTVYQYFLFIVDDNVIQK